MTEAGEPEPAPGTGLRRASWWGTGLFVATAGTSALALTVDPDGSTTGWLEKAAFTVAVLLFLAGCVLFLAAYARGVARSRTDEVAVTTLFFLAGRVAPTVRRSLFGSLGVQVVVALGTAIAHPYTSLAAGALVPMYGIGLCGLWSARHGSFPPRAQGPHPPKPGPGRTGRSRDEPSGPNVNGA